MATMFTIDGGLSGLKANLVWHSQTNRNYMLPNDSWAPVVGQRSTRALSGYGPYEIADEERSVHVFGGTEAEATANLDILARLFDQAERFAAGEYPYPVIIRYQPNGSSVLHEARILARLAGDATHLQLPASFNEKVQRFEIPGVRLRYRRTEWIEIASAENFLANWSFEDLTSGTATAPQWTATGTPTLELQDESGGIGPTHGVIHLSITGAAGAERGIYQDVTGLTAGQRYIISADVRPFIATMILRATDGGGSSNPVSASYAVVQSLARLTIAKVCPAGGSIRVWLLIDSAGGSGWVDGVILALSANAVEDIDTNLSNVAVAGVPLLSTVGDHWAASPMRAEFLLCDSSGVELGTRLSFWPSYLILSNSISNIETQAADDFTTALAQWTKPAAVGADQSYGGNLLRYTPTVTTANKDPNYVFTFSSTALSYSRILGLRAVAFAVIKASVANNFTVRGSLASFSGVFDNEVFSEPVVVTTTAVTIIPLLFPAPLRSTLDGGEFVFSLEVTAAAVTGTLDFDRITVANISPDAETTILRLNDTLNSTSTTYFAGRVLVDSLPTTHPQPEVVIYNPLANPRLEYPLSIDGSPTPYMRGTQVAGAWIAVGNAEANVQGAYWQWYGSVSLGLIRNRLRVTRRRVRTVPR